MPLPVAHGLLGASVVAALQPKTSLTQDTKHLWLGAFLGICPDFDYLLNVLPGFGRGWHHGFTHSFGFALLAGLVASAVLFKVNARNILTYGLATLSHPLLDFLITEARGVELLWPFSARRFKLRLPNPIDYSWSNTSLWDTAADILRICLVELMIFAPIFLAILFVKRAIVRREASA